MGLSNRTVPVWPVYNLTFKLLGLVLSCSPQASHLATCVHYCYVSPSASACWLKYCRGVHTRHTKNIHLDNQHNTNFLCETADTGWYVWACTNIILTSAQHFQRWGKRRIDCLSQRTQSAEYRVYCSWTCIEQDSCGIDQHTAQAGMIAWDFWLYMRRTIPSPSLVRT